MYTHLAIVSTVSPCALVCQAIETGQLFIRSNQVIDGTPCYSGTFDHAVCIEGECRVSYLLSRTMCVANMIWGQQQSCRW